MIITKIHQNHWYIRSSMNYYRQYKPPQQFPEGVSHLLIINVLVFFVTQLPQVEPYLNILIGHSFFSPYFRFWQVITHMFMHADIGHLFSNMFGLWMFGRILCSVWDTKRFLFFYFSCGLAAYFAHQGYLFYEFGSQPPADGIGDGFLGASGAVYGVLVSFATLFPNSQVMLIIPPIPMKAKYMIGLILLIDIFAGFSGRFATGIAHFAHLGGALCGFLMTKYWQNSSKLFY